MSEQTSDMSCVILVESMATIVCVGSVAYTDRSVASDEHLPWADHVQMKKTQFCPWRMLVVSPASVMVQSPKVSNTNLEGI